MYMESDQALVNEDMSTVRHSNGRHLFDGQRYRTLIVSDLSVVFSLVGAVEGMSVVMAYQQALLPPRLLKPFRQHCVLREMA